MKNIIICGMLGSGYKETAEKLNEYYHLRLVDTDEILVRNIGTDLFDIYSSFPLEVRNDLAERLSRQIAASKDLMVIAGESVYSDRSAMSELKEECIIVYIKQSIESILTDCKEPQHPLIKRDLKQLELLYPKRDKVMTEYADIIIEDCSDLKELSEMIGVVKKERLPKPIFDDSELKALLMKKYATQNKNGKNAEAFAEKMIEIINKHLI